MFVSADYFKTIGVTLARGPGFDGDRRTEPVVILGYRFWQNRLGSDPDIIGKTLNWMTSPMSWSASRRMQFDGHLGFQGRELFVPLERHPLLRDKTSNVRFDRGKEWMHIHGRLSPGVSVAAGERGGCRRHIAAGQRVSGDERVQGRHRRGVRPARQSRSLQIQAPSGCGVHPDRHGAAGRVPEYLRHDAGSQRDA